MKTYLKGLITIALISISALLTAQKHGEIKGHIYDEAGEPMGYANVHLMGTSSGTISDDKGFLFHNAGSPGNI